MMLGKNVPEASDAPVGRRMDVRTVIESEVSAGLLYPISWRGGSRGRGGKDRAWREDRELVQAVLL
jgi:hypothetical protein